MYRTRQTSLEGLVLFDGPIGAGKTTLVHKLAQEFEEFGYRVLVVQEKIPKELAEYYADPALHAYNFQMGYLKTLYMEYAKACWELYQGNVDIVLLDRWFYSTRAFFEYQYTKGWINSKQHDTLSFISNLLLVTTPFLPKVLVYVDEDIKTCFERTQQRGRGGEEVLTEEWHRELSTFIRKYNHLDKDVFKSSSVSLANIFWDKRFIDAYQEMSRSIVKRLPTCFVHKGIHPDINLRYCRKLPIIPHLHVSGVEINHSASRTFCTHQEVEGREEVIRTLLGYISNRLPKTFYDFLLNDPFGQLPCQKSQ